MHTHTIRTKFTFGDRVRYDAEKIGSGVGRIQGITVDEAGHYYLIEPDEADYIQGGILEHEITPEITEVIS